MLSILIPIYNYDPTKLVTELHRQGMELSNAFEIIVFDDGSHSAINKVNERLNTLEHVLFRSLEKNVGLSENRNLLAQASRYENILFIDGDSLIEENFIQNYIDALQPSSEVVYGGRVHPKDYPDTSNLRWQYGTYVEDKTAKERKKHPYRSTLFNNTLIKKNTFKKVGFEKTLTTYGHEDTLFSYALKELRANIQHIDNPVIHGDIDANDIFVKKTRSGLDNLKYLYETEMINPDYVRLLQIYSKFQRWRLHGVLGGIYTVFKKPITQNLTSKKPSLFTFNLFRLTYFCHINR